MSRAWALCNDPKACHAWVFRGDVSRFGKNPPLETSLERACTSWDVKPQNRAKVERRLVREFQRQPEAFNFNLQENDCLGWLAAMQHYGAPTRLLDWTYSPFIAAYFALDKLLSELPNRHSCDCIGPRAAVWAINTKWLNIALYKVLSAGDRTLYRKKDPVSFTELYIKPSRRVFVGAVNPLRLNERLSIQQGLFLVPCDLCRTWEANLEALGDVQGDDKIQLFVIESKNKDMVDAFKDLTRMNVTSRSLFPGVSGLARSLLHRLLALLKTRN